MTLKKILYMFAITALVLGMASCGDEPQIQSVYNPNSEKGMMPGKFTVDAEGTQVQFSQGNLQYNSNLGEKGTWRFATNQWDAVGKVANELIGRDEVQWIDLFGWSTDATYYGVNISANNDTYSGDFKDWGNIMGNGWHTLSKDEWVYIFYGRTDAKKLFGLGSVADVNGLILLPDDWEMPEDVPEFHPSMENGMEDMGKYFSNEESYANNFLDNTYDAVQWDKMEKEGAIFLPAAGCRVCYSSLVVVNVNANGSYWSSTPYVKKYAYYMFFYDDDLRPQHYYDRSEGRSVRLVR